jgi:hypothetical protein
MRDPNRIQKFCNQLADIWRTVPDWRFSQMIVSALAIYENRHGNDAFYVEDEEFLEFLKDFVYHYTNKR